MNTRVEYKINKENFKQKKKKKYYLHIIKYRIDE